MKNLFLTVSAICIFSVTTVGQIAFGPKFGFLQSQITDFELATEADNNTFHTGIELGVAARFGEGIISFYPGLSYIQLGSEVEYPGYSIDYLRGYIHLPLMANIRFYQNGVLRIHGLVGPYVSFATNTRATLHVAGQSYQPEDITYDFDDVDNDGVTDRRWDFGLTGGLGGQVDNIFFEGKVIYGLTEINSYENYVEEPDYSLKNFAITISVGYLFNGDPDEDL